MLSILGTILGGVLSGGATGLLGVLLQRFFDYKSKSQDIELHKLNLANTIELSKLESERAFIRAEVERQQAELDAIARETEADSRNLVASYENDRAAYLTPGAQLGKGFWPGTIRFMMALVDFMRGILRPAMTAYLCGLVTIMFLWVREVAANANLTLTSDQAVQIMLTIISTILYVFTTCATWWFGSRPPKIKG